MIPRWSIRLLPCAVPGALGSKGSLACAVLLLCIPSIQGATNDWTKATSGNWEEPYWSLGRLPGIDQGLVVFGNPGWKALAISANTAANYAASLALNNLVVEAPVDSFNQLLLNWAGLEVPLSVHWNLVIRTNASLASHHSALRVANAYIYGAAVFSDDSKEDFGLLALRSGATVNLTNGNMTCSNLTFGIGRFTQAGGTNIVQSIHLPTSFNPYSERASGSYHLIDGALTSQQLLLGWPVGPAGNGDGRGTFLQDGGVHINSGMGLQAYYHPGGSTFAGRYVLKAGLLLSEVVGSDGGYFGISGGTAVIQELSIRGGTYFELSGGELVTSNVFNSVDTYVGGRFAQSGGTHTVLEKLLVAEHGYSSTSPEYSVSGGALNTKSIELRGILEVSSQGMISNKGVLVVSNGTLVANGVLETQHLGQLLCAGGSLKLNVYGLPATPTVLRFAENRDLAWTGPLRIQGWSGSAGDHIFFGTNANGLSAAQLAKVEFVVGYDAVSPAILLDTGEVVPTAGTNEWTKPISGNWEESYWSLGRLPGMDQNLVKVSNSGWKAVSIGAGTAANYPGSLSMYNLVIAAPTDSYNQLLLNWAGLGVPLSVYWNLTIGANGSLVSRSSALNSAKTYIYGSLYLSDGSVANLSEIWLRDSGALDFSDGFLSSSMVGIDGGSFSQNGGTHVAQRVWLPTKDYFGLGAGAAPPPGYYYLNGGTLVSEDMLLDSSRDSYGAVTYGVFMQSGGVHTNSSLNLWNRSGRTARGSYVLDGGLLVTASLYPDNGSFTQNGGTNIVGELRNRGEFILNGGRLVSSNTAVTFSTFVHSGGAHMANHLLIGAGYEYDGGHSTYELTGGSLVTAEIKLSTGSLNLSSSGAVSNAGTLTFFSNFPGRVRADNVEAVQHLGRLQMSFGGTVDLHSFPARATRATVLRFLDSHELAWSGQLLITNWGLHSGDHIFFGTDAQALTQGQLAQVQFAVNGTNYPAKLLATGELVPAIPPPLTAYGVADGIVISWPGGGFELLSATDVEGPYVVVPGATSPITNSITGDRRFFRLRAALP